jgi:hypothetical protein
MVHTLLGEEESMSTLEGHTVPILTTRVSYAAQFQKFAIAQEERIEPVGYQKEQLDKIYNLELILTGF